MSMHGAGLLALLRKRSEPEAPQLGIATEEPAAAAAATAANKFEARSSAVHALEHAVASGNVTEASKSAAQGRRIPPGPSYTYDVDVHVPHEAQPQLSVTPVTLINSDYALHHYHQIAVSRDYICYGLKQGHIRVLSRHSAVRALLKGHTKPLTDLQFAGGAGADGEGGSLLASGGQDGRLFVWQLVLDEGAAAIRETQKLHAHFMSAGGSAGNVFLSWHASQRVLAAGVGGKVLLVSVPTQGVEQLEFDLEDDSTPDATVLPDWTGEAVTSLAFSPDGQLLAAGGADGTVRVWQLQQAPDTANGGHSLLAVHSVAILADSGDGDGGVGSVRWLPTPGFAGSVLLTGNHNNSRLQLWHGEATAAGGGDGGRGWALLQSLQFVGRNGQQDFFNHVEVVGSQELVVLADTARKAVCTLHYSGAGTSLRFDYLARFGVALPILSFTALWNPAGGEQADTPLVELNCVQTSAIQQYSLDPQLCYNGTAVEEYEAEAAAEQHDVGVVRRSSLLERHGRDLSIQAQPSAAVPMPSEDLATPRTVAAAIATAAVAAAAAAAEAAEEAERAAAAAAAAAAPQQPEPPTAAAPAEAAAPAAEPSMEDTVPPLSSIPPPPAPESQGASGVVTPEECPSPPPTPTEQRVQEAAAAEAMAAAPPPPPPRLLTPSDLLQSASSSTPTTGRSTPTTDGGGRRRASPPSVHPPPPRCILQRNGDAAAGASPAPPPLPIAPALAAVEASEVTTAGELVAAASSSTPAAAAAATPSSAASAAAAAPSGAGAGGSSPQLDEAAIAAAVGEAMGGVHKKFLGHVSLMYRELLKAMKAEMGAQVAAQQQATAQLLAAALEAQKQQIEVERAAVLAEERSNIERLLTAISATLNRDLPVKLQEAVRGELAGMADSLAATVAPAVQQALAATLPKELSGAVKTGLDKQLAPAVAAGLGKPLQEAFRSAFAKQLVPAFEGATQSMFQQINTAFSAGFEDHLQACQAALAEPAKLATQLAASLTSAQALAASLNQGQQQLLRAQSLSSSAAEARSPAAPVDEKVELTSLLRASKYDAAFSRALSLQDVGTLGWLVTQVDAAAVLGREPCPLSQMVLLSLVQQLSADLTTNLGAKLTWIREAAMVINPQDAVLARHLRPVLEGVHAALQAAAARVQGKDASSCRLAMHVVHSQLTS